MSTLIGLISGTLLFDPESKTSDNGHTYARATITHSDGDRRYFVRMTAFGDDVEELMKLRKGAAVSAVGRLRPTAYIDKTQQPAAGADIVITRLQPLAPQLPNTQTSTAPFDPNVPLAELKSDPIPF